MSFIKRIHKIMDKQLTKIENNIDNHTSSEYTEKSIKFQRELKEKTSNSQSRINNLRKSIQNTKQ
ncbi:hypothetical protein [Clostridium sp. D53t1_180928_C8]|uniref:hypothetical protein n=1 Tax=Clostridium sp. D53t1_180928_C8 TaxID=2787101 RepID=UPI0018AAD964|nr:hypothetical protein [Clostridium sp. D53t1_180928_C8]